MPSMPSNLGFLAVVVTGAAVHPVVVNTFIKAKIKKKPPHRGLRLTQAMARSHGTSWRRPQVERLSTTRCKNRARPACKLSALHRICLTAPSLCVGMRIAHSCVIKLVTIVTHLIFAAKCKSLRHRQLPITQTNAWRLRCLDRNCSQHPNCNIITLDLTRCFVILLPAHPSVQPLVGPSSLIHNSTRETLHVQR